MEVIRKYCLILSFYIKPQPSAALSADHLIVLYCLSTSNHNYFLVYCAIVGLSYIVFLHQTTTNLRPFTNNHSLSYIVFLHQTTTGRCTVILKLELSYIVFLHQTTTPWGAEGGDRILSYIVFLHQTTTSTMWRLCATQLSYIVFLHQTTTLLIYSSDYQSVLSYLKQ